MKAKSKVAGWMILLLVFAGPLALAKGPGGGHGHGGDFEGGSPSGFGKGGKQGWQGKSTPPGWSKGQKKGWDGADMPPGLEKKKNGFQKDSADKDAKDEKDKDGN